jgi:type II restriction/modification system DNA methylase subunit YeeA
MYVSIQNEIEAAYNELRSRRAEQLGWGTYKQMLKDYKDNPSDALKGRIDQLKKEYPQIISEPEPITN